MKKTLREIGQLSTHALAVDAEQEPQLWSTRQPWFRERLEALQRKISKK